MGFPAQLASIEKVKVISREDIPAVNYATVSGELHNLGLLLDFRKNKDLAVFMPEQSRFSMSWVRLRKEETLSIHQHPTASMIILTSGEGMVVGDSQRTINEGDAVIVPPNCKHGFIGKGKSGFWGLSVQFEGLGLYEDMAQPRVKFTGKTDEDEFKLLLKDQEKYEKHFRKNALMKLLASEHIKKKDVRERLLEALNFWSDWFQRILAARVATGSPKAFQILAEQHWEEEAGHNKELLSLRGNKPISLWDPILDAAASWFYQRALSGTPEEKTVLMHCVLEAASHIFHSKAQEYFPGATHFKLHSALDEEHTKMGFEILKASPNIDLHEMRSILWEGWRMMEYLTSRMAHYAKTGNS